MRNLKKVLALVLALVMSLSLVTIANAASFSDADDIQYTEAVEVLTALEVIDGVGNNTFNPKGNVTRAQMAKMITIVALGNVSADAFLGTTTDLKDINGHWAEAYIKYCYSQGIISGKGAGIFDPNANVTCAEAAKMLLVAIGYNSSVQGYTGSQWAINVQRDATTSKFYKDMAVPATQDLTRDQAAQLIYNAIQADMIKKTSNVDREDGSIVDIYAPDPGKTLLTETFEGAIKMGYLEDFTYDEVKGQWTYSFQGDGTPFGGAAIDSDDKIETDVYGGTKDLKSTVDYTEFFGQQVKVVYSTKDNDVIYGVFANDSSVIASGATGNIGDIDAVANTVKVSGTAYKVNNTAIPVYYFGVPGVVAGASLATLKTDKSAYNFTLVDNNGDNKADAVIVTPVTVAKIIYIGSDTITFGSGIGIVNKDDIVMYDGYAKDDWVYYTAAAYAPTVTRTAVKAELKTSTVDGVKGATAAAGYTEYMLDGSWYAASNNGTYTASIENAEVNDTIEYVTLGSTVFYAKITDVAATTKNIAMVITADNVLGEGDGNHLGTTVVKAKLMTADGTKSVVTVAKVNGVAATFGTTPATDVDDRIGTLVTYRVNSDGEYELTDVSASNLAGYKGIGTNAAYTNETIGGKELADDATVFVFIGTASQAAAGANDGKVYTGKEIKNAYGAGTIATASALPQINGTDAVAALWSNVSGFTYAQVAALNVTANLSITAGSNYGYLTTGAYKTVESDKTYLNFTFWTSNGEVKAKWEDTSAPADYPAGTIITYDVVSDGVIKNVSAVNAITSTVTGWDGTNKIQIAGLAGSAKVDPVDTVVIYIDSKNTKGAEGGAIQIGDDLNGDGTADQANIRYVGTAGSTLDLLVVDVNNKMENGPALTMTGTVTGTAVNNAFTSGNVSVKGTLSVTSSVTTNGNKFVGGGTLNVTGTIDETEAITTDVTLSTANDTVTLGAPNVKIGTVSGTIGSGSLLFGAGDCNGKAVYQFTINDSRFVNGVTKVNVGGAATSGVVMNTNNDLAIRFGTAETKVINIDFDGDAATTNDQVSWTVTAPTF